MNKNKYLQYFIAVASTFALAPASAQQYPSKPVRLVVPFAPGGGTDTLARMVAQRLTETLGQTVVVDNRPAVDGIIGSETVAKAAPDGYTLILVSSSHAINPALRKSLPYDTLKDFAPITQTAIQQLLLVTHASVPAKNVKELIALLKADSSKYNYGSSSNATALPMELLKSMSGTQVQHIPYKGTGPMMNDLLGGQVQMGIVGAVSAIPQVKSGRLRGLAIGDSKRSASLPDIPTIAESGVPGYQASIWTGLFGPAKLPRAIIDKVNKDVVGIVQQPEFKARMNQMGSETVGSTPEAWGRFIEVEIVKWAKIAKIAGLKPE
ncbi:MAG TPA: tripartite tricarboxylate transporter substrate binding protein [Burkholderiales bacterium]|nr:tripartite tricarboxylate transporter substrate binding protein [Burkholderiales bacterium]